MGAYLNGFLILIYDLDKVLAGDITMPRKISLGRGHYISKGYTNLLVDKTSITVVSQLGSVVNVDFWRC